MAGTEVAISDASRTKVGDFNKVKNKTSINWELGTDPFDEL